MKTEFDASEDLPQAPDTLYNQDPGLSSRQAEIHKNLQAIGPEIAAYYLDGLKILHSRNLENAASFLAHAAREIDGGLRDILSVEKKEELEFVIRVPNEKPLMEEKGREGTLKFTVDTPGPVKLRYKRIGKHKPSILQSLGVDDPTPLAERWIKATGKFYGFVHRHGAWKPPHSIEDFKSIWRDFEDVLADLVGNYLDLLIKVVDRILEYKKPTDEIRGVLPHLLKSDLRRKHFFENLASPAWLQPLKEDGWFDPESNVIVRPSQSSVKELDWYDWWKPLVDGRKFHFESSSLTKARTRVTETDVVSPWHALEYVERIAEHTKDHPCDETMNILVEILDAIVDCPEDIAKKIIGDWTLSKRITTIISCLPVDKKRDKHAAFEKLALGNLSKDFMPLAWYAHRLIESIEHNPNPAFREWLFKMSRGERIKFLGEAHEFVDKSEHLTEQGLVNIHREYVIVILQRLMSYLRGHPYTFPSEQCSALSGLLAALHDKKKFDWETFLEFIRKFFSLEHFWTDEQVNDFKYRNQILGDIAELIAVGMDNDAYDFDPQLLPLTEQILLVLVDKTELKCALKENPTATFLNSSRGMAFRAMINYILRFARTNNNQQEDFRWPQAIKDDFTKRLDKNIEPSFEFSFVLGAFLPQLLYLDKEWVIDNIDHIFPQQNEHHWYVSFSMYLISSRKICKHLYSLLQESAHYQKALNTNFAYHSIEIELAKHICTFWLEDYEKLDGETSLIYQVVSSNNPHFLSAVVHFFWDQRDNLSEEDKTKVRSAWRVMFKVVSRSKDSLLLSALSRWVVFIDYIDEEALTWLKFSAKHADFYFDIFVDALLVHALKTPKEVAAIYLELSKNARFSFFTSLPAEDKVIETIRILYDARHRDIANQICLQFAEAGFSFLKPLYNEYQP